MKDVLDLAFSEGAAKESYRRRIMFNAGVLDLNRGFSRLPQATIEGCGKAPHVKGQNLYPAIFELRQDLLSELDTGQFSAKGFENEHFLYPILEKGIVADIANTQIFTRLFGIHQLGLNRYYPLPNPHNRGEHSLYLAVNMLRTLQSLDEKDRDQLVVKLKADFEAEGLGLFTTSVDIIIGNAANLAVAIATLHDIGTPAGGDTIKYLTGKREEDTVEWLLSKENTSLTRQRDELLDVLASYGLMSKHISYILRCIQGKSKTLLGEMINPVARDTLDWDRMSYTLLDFQVTKILSNEVPEILTSDKLTKADNNLIARKLALLVQVLLNDYITVTGVSDSPPHDKEHLPTNYLDCTERFVLGPNGELVCTDPQRLAWLAAYRLFMTTHHYAGAQLLGLEWELQSRIQELQKQGKVNGLLSVENLLAITDDELFNQLAQSRDQKLITLIEKIKTIGGTPRFEGEIVDRDAKPEPEVIKSFNLSPKNGFGTLVEDKGTIMYLRDYLRRNPRSKPSKMIQFNPTQHGPKRIDIRRIGGSF